MGPPPKTSRSNPLKNHTCLEFGFYIYIYICYFGPHDSGQHPKSIICNVSFDFWSSECGEAEGVDFVAVLVHCFIQN